MMHTSTYIFGIDQVSGLGLNHTVIYYVIGVIDVYERLVWSSAHASSFPAGQQNCGLGES